MSTLERDLTIALLERYERACGDEGIADARRSQFVSELNSLRLAAFAFDKLALTQTHPTLPPQVVILGPTQAGKSSLVNLLLDEDSAGISPLAGYTVHAQGFALDNPDTTSLASLADFMIPLERVPADALEAGTLQQFALETVSVGRQALLRNAVLWDSPDFDSIESGGYRQAVLKNIALADALIVIVSKDKYADRSVWDMLELIRPLRQPILVCVNKLDPADANTVMHSFERRYTERFGDPVPPMITLPMTRQRNAQDRPVFDGKVLADLGNAVSTLLNPINRDVQPAGIHALVSRHREHWLAPVRDELLAADQWEALIQSALDDAEQDYARRYLNDPARYDTFNRALVELLQLLELPGIAAALARTRRWVTWPARQLLGAGQKAWARQQHTSGSPPPDFELDVIDALSSTVLSQLQARVQRQLNEDHSQTLASWQALHQQLLSQRGALMDRSEQAARQYQLAFTPQIDAAAHKLYAQLQRQPKLLNTLRAARVTTDAAGVALAVKSGGLAPTDLVLAPAMFSVTTLITESVLGQYMESIKRDLKRQQRQQVRRHVFNEALGVPLRALAGTGASDQSPGLTSLLDEQLRELLQRSGAL